MIKKVEELEKELKKPGKSAKAPEEGGDKESEIDWDALEFN